METGEWPIIDADGHVTETDADIYEYLPAPFHGASDLLTAPFFPTLDGIHRIARSVADGGRGVRGIPTGQDWLNYLNEANIALSVLFPTAGLGFGLITEADWAIGLARAYNDWLHDRFLSIAPSRLKGMALIPLQEPSEAARELRRAVQELGMVGGILPAAGLYEAFGNERFWPVYEEAQDLSCLLAVHGAPSYGLGLERLHRHIEARTLTHGVSQMVQLTSMIFGGVFDAFPQLRIAFCEAGCGWSTYMMERLDREYRARRTQAPELTRLPSEHLRSGRVFIHTELDEHGLTYAIERFGGDAFFCASDFPHEAKDEFRKGIAEFAGRGGISAADKRKILWDNPIRMYRLNVDPGTAATSWQR